MKLKFLSWNIWIDGYFDQVTDFLKKSEADIIGLQEVLSDDPRRDVISFLHKLGYEHIFAPIKKTWGDKVWSDGPAVFSKYKIQSSKTYILSKDDGRAAARADILIGNELLHVFSTHLIHTHQKQSDVQEEQGLNLIKELPDEHALVMGDFNAKPDSTVIKNMENVLINSDSTSQATWSVYTEGCKVCMPNKIDTKLDYIFVSKDLKASNFKVEESKASDHLPISVTVEM